MVVACAESATTAPEPEPAATTLYPIDVAIGTAGRPSNYRGFPMALTDNGTPTVTPVRGVIGLICVGMSNAAMECNGYASRVDSVWRDSINVAVRVVNCAVGNHAIERWIDSTYDATLWDACRETRIPAAGLAEDQVRVLYHKAANQFTLGPGGSPLPAYPDPVSDIASFQRNLTAFSLRVTQEFPAVQAVYTTSRSYGGWAPSAARGEPLSYEEGHALNAWLANHPSVDGVWYGWGPYIWAPTCSSGMTNGGGLCYERSDFVADGVHPSTAGIQKVGALIHRHFSTAAWYRPSGS
jgi:hypothetical protein